MGLTHRHTYTHTHTHTHTHTQIILSSVLLPRSDQGHESCLRYYMILWKHYVSHCPRLIFKTHRIRRTSFCHFTLYLWISWPACVCRCVCVCVSVCVIMSLCAFPCNVMLFQAWSHPVHRRPVGGLWAAELSCIAETELVVLWYDLRNRRCVVAVYQQQQKVV